MGEPFDADKVDEITSLFRSTKSVSECIGNKGVGFKAVFQITDATEIYSSRLGESLADGVNLGFRIVRRPLEEVCFREQLRKIVDEILAEQPHRREAIVARFQTDDAANSVLGEAERAAGFKFPLEAESDRYANRLAEYGVDAGAVNGCQTLIVLPVDPDDPEVQRLIDEALDEIVGHDVPDDVPPASSLLFLTGVDRIEISDQARSYNAHLVRTPPESVSIGSHGVSIESVTTKATISHALSGDDEPLPPDTQKWWVARRLLGSTDDERAAVRGAIADLRLPADNWKDVRDAPVAIAIPYAEDDSIDDVCALGTDGRFCIGLPTQMETGSPIWVNAPFHGTISRTKIVLENKYNALLFDTAMDLARSLAERFKSDASPKCGRLTTLMMERGTGPVADHFYSDDGLATTDIVYTWDGQFITPSDLSIPAASDAEMFMVLVEGAGDPRQYGFVLPDRGLLLGARSVLDKLCKDSSVSDSAYAIRSANNLSLLEHATRHHRSDGESFWKPFFEWLLTRSYIDEDTLQDQVILPVGNGELARSRDRVFFRPFAGDGGTDEASDTDVEDEELADIDDEIADLLNFFDETALQARRPNSRVYTNIAARLSSDRRPGLVNLPRLEDLINYAVIPAMKDASDDNDLALRLLYQAVLWLNQMKPKSQTRVKTGELLVPAFNRPQRQWQWTEPDSVYLGEGWEDGKNNELLTKAFGSRPNSQLVPWQIFEKRARSLFESADRTEWCHGMSRLGVWDSPRMLSLAHKPPVLLSHDKYPLSVNHEVKCPPECESDVWNSYLNRIRFRRSQTFTTYNSYKFHLLDVLWIDGLEDPALRPTVVEAVLRRPEAYREHMATQLSRFHGGDPSDVPALWLHALRTAEWQAFPTSQGLKTVDAAWWVEASDRRRRGYSLLPSIPGEYGSAKFLLDEIGVCSLDNAPLRRLVSALHQTATWLSDSEDEGHSHALTLAMDLYERIDRQLEEAKDSNDLESITEAPVPLERDGILDAADLTEIDQIFVDDDVVRRQHISMPAKRWTLPVRFERTYEHLVHALTEIFGKEKVVRVSEMRLAVNFDPITTPMPLLEYLTKEFPGKSVAEDMALLIVKGGGRTTSPGRPRFLQKWKLLESTNVVFGRFANDDCDRICFDQQAEGGPTLMLPQGVAPCKVVASGWRIVGPAYEDIWERYASALDAERENAFLANKRITSRERIEVEAVIKTGFVHRLERYEAACLAIWRRTRQTDPIEEFLAGWDGNTNSPEEAARWLRLDGIEGIIEQAIDVEEPRGSVLLLDKAGLSVEAWQTARRQLGLDPFVFIQSTDWYRQAQLMLAARLQAFVAHLSVPAASGRGHKGLPAETLPRLRAWIETSCSSEAPGSIAHANVTEAQAIAHVGKDALRLADTHDVSSVLTLVIEPLTQLTAHPPSRTDLIELKREPGRAAAVYLDVPLESRMAEAKDDISTVIKVAEALAQYFHEPLDSAVVKSDVMVDTFSDSWWANRISVLAAVRYALERLAPKTAERLKEQRAFRDVEDWQTLWRKFPELGEPQKPAAPGPEKTKFKILGQTLAEDDFHKEAGSGSDGMIAEKIAEFIDAELDLAAFLGVARSSVEPLSRGKRKRRPGWRPPKSQKDDKKTAILGAIGERFFFQQFKALFDDFDHHNWKSENREKFGFSEGNDTLGFDFEYRDWAGRLTGRENSPMCRIEVKATTGDGTQPFDMSTNEWEVAYDCHNSDGKEVYIIVRIRSVDTKPFIADVLVDPIAMREAGVLDYSSRNLLVAVGKAGEDAK
ncbi:MAG: DUF3883 domain-containing protein [Fuerstiella sp.]